MNRVEEVRELKAFLQENYMTESGALRTAIECVYGLADQFYEHNYTSAGIDRKEQREEEWKDVDKIDFRTPDIKTEL